jgi:hydroxyacyl-ACP dehydratase HTD2-like protein with hotdog domain
LGPGRFVGSAGDNLGGYFQIQRTNNSPGNAGQVVFSDITIVPQVNLNIALNGNQTVLYWPAGATNFVVQTTTNLASTNWTTVTNGTPIMGITVTNNPGAPAMFYRLQWQ